MKELIDVHDYLISSEIVGDWDGEEEEVIDWINIMIHHAYQLFPDEISGEQAERIFVELWAAVVGQDFILESELDELEDWLVSFINQKINDIEID
jgi:hypothetical protein